MRLAWHIYVAIDVVSAYIFSWILVGLVVVLMVEEVG